MCACVFVRGRLGLSPRKWSINRFKGWCRTMGFEGSGVGGVNQNETFVEM